MQRTSAPTQLIERNGKTVARRLHKVRVSVIEGPDKGASFEGAQDEIRIGGAGDNDLVLNDPSVSRRHVLLRLTPTGIRVSDAGSTNGTFIGEIRVHDVVLSGDQHELNVGADRVRIEALSDSVDREVSAGVRFGRLVGTSLAMREVFAVLERVAASDVGLLVEGETGVGKELVADAVHRQGARRGGPFIALDCGAILKESLEGELFGVDRAADPNRARAGAFASAEGGTLFLDEINELSQDLQVKLLRAIETGEVRPVGADRPVKIDARVIVASARGLLREVKEGRFRQDLYYRLASVAVRLPPLRARLDDVPVLADTVLEDINRHRVAQGLSPYPGLDRRAMDLLVRYDFPGNVRELRNLVERFAVLGPDPAALTRRTTAEQVEGHEIRTDLPFHDSKEIWTEIFERTYLTRLLETHKGNVSAAARTSGIDRRHLQRLMVKHDLREREPSSGTTGQFPAQGSGT